MDPVPAKTRYALPPDLFLALKSPKLQRKKKIHKYVHKKPNGKYQMAFLLYERLTDSGASILRPTGENFRLAGYNLVFQAWEKRCKPTNQGWHVSADELVRIHTSGAENNQTRRLIIDFHPSSVRRIGLIELLDIYAYTYEADTPGDAGWTPMMFRLRDIFYEEYDHDITPDEKALTTNSLSESQIGDEFVEFLYLGGPSWAWGKNGKTNAVFLKKPVREYFRTFF